MFEAEKLKIALIGSKTLTGQKISFILKRKYIIRELELLSENKNDCNYNIAIINSEFLADYIIDETRANEAGVLLEQFVLLCKTNKTKIIFIEFDFVLKNNKLYSTNTNKYYSEILMQIENRMNDTVDLTVKASISYGQTILGEKDLTDLLQDSEWITQQNMDMKLFPKLNDEIALQIDRHLSDKGEINLRSGDAIALRDWADLLSKADDSILNKKDFPVCSNEKYIDLIKGYITKKKQYRCSFQLVYQLKPIQIVEGRSVARFRYRLGETLSNAVPEEIRNEIDFVCPVPNTGLYYAMGLAAGLKIPYLQALEKVNNEIRSFNFADTDTRKKICWNKIQPIKELLQGKNVAIVDEAIFTGTTLKVVCTMLKECSVKAIHLCIPTPICRFHCENYIHPERSMLLEYLHPNMLQDYFGVDSICFQNEKVFIQELSPYKMTCTECFLGKEGCSYE